MYIRSASFEKDKVEKKKSESICFCLLSFDICLFFSMKDFSLI